MTVSVLHIEDCTNWVEAGERLRNALAALGRSDVVGFVLIEDAATAERTGFAGSPTLVADGVDLFPEGAPTTALACRVYRTPTGLAGLPTTEQIANALAQR